jgi:hemolysin activation/secretion protein
MGSMRRAMAWWLVLSLPATVWGLDRGGLTSEGPVEPLGAPEYRQEEAPPALGLPPMAPPVTPAPITPTAPDLPGVPRFVLNGVQFEGHSVFSSEQLRTVAAPWLGKAVGMADLEDLRLALTRHYEGAGYVGSGALLPDQHIQQGVVRYRIVEGRLTEINVSGSEGLAPEYVSERLRLGLEGPLDVDVLRERFQLLLNDPLIERLNGALRPGLHLGESRLDLAVTRARPYELALVVDNHRPPSTGAEQARAEGVVRNLTGWGDQLALDLARSDGAWEGNASFSMPLDPRDTRLGLFFSRTDSSVIEEPLEAVDIDSDTQSWGLDLSRPLIQNLDESLLLGLAFDLRRSRTSLLGEGTPFSDGVESDGEARVRVLRFRQDYTWRGTREAFAARSTFSAGLDVFGATHNDTSPDGRFLTWVGQAQYAHKIGDAGAQLILRGDLQLADKQLLPLEQFAVGGANSVRGYRENQLVRDQGYRVSAEYRQPIRAEVLTRNNQQLEWIAFVEAGGAAYKGASDAAEHLWSAGLGLRWRWERLTLELDWAHGFKEVSKPTDHDLQDDGIHFLVRLDLF